MIVDFALSFSALKKHSGGSPSGASQALEQMPTAQAGLDKTYHSLGRNGTGPSKWPFGAPPPSLAEAHQGTPDA